MRNQWPTPKPSWIERIIFWSVVVLIAWIFGGGMYVIGHFVRKNW